MKRIQWYKTDTLNIEIPLGIINIRSGLSDNHGRPVASIQIIAVADNNEPVKLVGSRNTRLIQLKGKRKR